MRSALVLTILITLTGAAAAADRNSAWFCVAVDVHGQDSLALWNRFDNFAAEQALLTESSHPVVRSYRDASSTFEITVRRDMGRFGAIVSSFEFQPAGRERIERHLEVFLAQRIASEWKVTRCSDTVGFGIPQIIQ